MDSRSPATGTGGPARVRSNPVGRGRTRSNSVEPGRTQSNPVEPGRRRKPEGTAPRALGAEGRAAEPCPAVPGSRRADRRPPVHAPDEPEARVPGAARPPPRPDRRRAGDGPGRDACPRTPDAGFPGSLQSPAVHSRGRAPGREPLGSPGFFAAIVLLYGFSIPWWFPAGEPGFLFGMPLWALASLGGTLAISGLTAFLALRRWDDDFDDRPPPTEAPPGIGSKGRRRAGKPAVPAPGPSPETLLR